MNSQPSSHCKITGITCYTKMLYKCMDTSPKVKSIPIAIPRIDKYLFLGSNNDFAIFCSNHSLAIIVT